MLELIDELERRRAMNRDTVERYQRAGKIIEASTGLWSWNWEVGDYGS